MSVNNRPTSGIRSDKPDGSGSVQSNDLARLDTRNLTIHNNDNKDSKTEQKKPYDPDGILEGQPVLECIFCDKYRTAIEFDMELHLHEKHRLELLRQFLLKEKGYSMDLRAEYFVYQSKIGGQKSEQIKNTQAAATDMKELSQHSLPLLNSSKSHLNS